MLIATNKQTGSKLFGYKYEKNIVKSFIEDCGGIDNVIIEKEPYKKYKKEEILQEFEQKMKALTKAYPEQEQKTWGQQLEEARAYIADNTADVPMLTAIADGGDIEVLAKKIVAKAHFLKVESGKLLAEKNKRLAELENE